MKEYAFLQAQEQNLTCTFYNSQFSNGPPKDHTTPYHPVTDLQGYINEGWIIVNTNISVPTCEHGAAVYRFILEREVPS